MIMYESTRGSKQFKTGAQAVIQGMAPDGGLYLPDSLPRLPRAWPANLPPSEAAG